MKLIVLKIKEAVYTASKIPRTITIVLEFFHYCAEILLRWQITPC